MDVSPIRTALLELYALANEGSVLQRNLNSTCSEEKTANLIRARSSGSGLLQHMSRIDSSFHTIAIAVSEPIGRVASGTCIVSKAQKSFQR